MKKNIIAIGILMLVIVATLSGCTETREQLYQAPEIEITSKKITDYYIDSEHVVYCYVTIYNDGGSGRVTVWAYLKAQEGISRHWSYDSSVSTDIGRDETRSVVIVFDEWLSWFDSLDDTSPFVWVTIDGIYINK